MKSTTLFDRAVRVIPGGVNSPVRAFHSVGGTPLYVASGKGSHIRSVEGRDLLDFCCSWGAIILGHAHPEVVAAIQHQAAQGTTFGINTPLEVEFAERLQALAPHLERIRLVSSGTEAVMTAVRIARGATGRDRILKFDGCYHGHSDGLLVAAGSGLLTGGICSSAGVPAAVAGDVFVVPFNDLPAVDAVVAAHGTSLAAILVEPVAANMGLVKPEPGFLEGLRRAADRCGAVLIFDEVITGFRFGPTTYGALCGVIPDLTTLGKIIGGGMPLAAVGGRSELMDCLAPLGRVYQAGTLSGNPVAVAAGLATLRVLERENPYARIAALTQQAAAHINRRARELGRNLHCAQEGGLFTCYFQPGPVRNLADARASNTQAYAASFHRLLDAGIYLPPSQFEVGFVSMAHTEDEVMRLADGIVA
jgi:glutamate-1-semialdehyde 2,1-aminomutase